MRPRVLIALSAHPEERLRDTAARWVGAFVVAVRARLELGSLVLLALVAAALWGFGELADQVSEGDTRAFDRAFLQALREPGDPSNPWGPLWFEEIARDCTALGGMAVLILLTAGTAGLLALQGHPRTAGYVLLTVGAGLVASVLLKGWFDRPRPDLVPHLSHVYTSSFPSGHSMMSALTYLTIAGLAARHQPRRRVKVFLMTGAGLLALLVGASRVYLGVHYPTDVAAGWTAGAAWALACVLGARWLGRHGEIEAEAPERAGASA